MANTNQKTDALAPVNNLRAFLETRRDKLAEWAGGAVEPAELIKFALFEYSRSTQLQKCSPSSIYAAIITAAQLGLSPSVTRGEGAIVPYKGTAQFQPMYRGLIKLARRNGPVKSIYAHVVHAGDTFVAKLGTSPEIIHELSFKNRGEPIAVYAVARLEDDDPVYNVMGWDEVEQIRAVASDKSEAWQKWPGEMAKKSAIKRLCKVLPTGEQFDQASRIDDMIEKGDVDGYRDVIDIGEVEIDSPAPAQEPGVKGVASVKAKIAAKQQGPTPINPAAEPPPCADCGVPTDNGERCAACAS